MGKKGRGIEERDVRQNKGMSDRTENSTRDETVLEETLESEKQRRCNGEALKGEIKTRFWRKRGDEGSKG